VPNALFQGTKDSSVSTNENILMRISTRSLFIAKTESFFVRNAGRFDNLRQAGLVLIKVSTFNLFYYLSTIYIIF